MKAIIDNEMKNQIISFNWAYFDLVKKKTMFKNAVDYEKYLKPLKSKKEIDLSHFNHDLIIFFIEGVIDSQIIFVDKIRNTISPLMMDGISIKGCSLNDFKAVSKSTFANYAQLIKPQSKTSLFH